MHEEGSSVVDNSARNGAILFIVAFLALILFMAYKGYEQNTKWEKSEVVAVMESVASSQNKSMFGYSVRVSLPSGRKADIDIGQDIRAFEKGRKIVLLQKRNPKNNRKTYELLRLYK